MELHQFSSQFMRQSLVNNDTQMKLKCSQLLIDFQQQCIFIVHVNFQVLKIIFKLIFLFF